MSLKLRNDELTPIIYKSPDQAPELAKFMNIDLKTLPKHVAFIMDGNGRWAVGKGKKRTFGHRAGVSILRELVKSFSHLNIPVMTVYAFSTENWQRSYEEVNFLMSLFEESIVKECQELKENGVKVRFIGRLEDLRPSLQEKIGWIIKETAQNSKVTLNIAINYGGRSEIIDAIKKIVEQTEKGIISKDDINEEMFPDYLYTASLPDPDLIIRTSGEFRISNYLLWQMAYSEIWVTETCWPDFTVPEFLTALYEYQNRDRKFGKVLK